MNLDLFAQKQNEYFVHNREWPSHAIMSRAAYNELLDSKAWMRWVEVPAKADDAMATCRGVILHVDDYYDSSDVEFLCACEYCNQPIGRGDRCSKCGAEYPWGRVGG